MVLQYFLQVLGQCTSALYSVQCLHPFFFVLDFLTHSFISLHVKRSSIFLRGSLNSPLTSFGEVGLFVGFGVDLEIFVGDCVGKLVGLVLGSVDWLTVGSVDGLAVGSVDG